MKLYSKTLRMSRRRLHCEVINFLFLLIIIVFIPCLPSDDSSIIPDHHHHHYQTRKWRRKNAIKSNNTDGGKEGIVKREITKKCKFSCWLKTTNDEWNENFLKEKRKSKKKVVMSFHLIFPSEKHSTSFIPPSLPFVNSNDPLKPISNLIPPVVGLWIVEN